MAYQKLKNGGEEDNISRWIFYAHFRSSWHQELVACVPQTKESHASLKQLFFFFFTIHLTWLKIIEELHPEHISMNLS